MNEPAASRTSDARRDVQEFAEILRIEAEAIELVRSRLNAASISAALEAVLNCNGKVIVTGVGKSGIIADKIAQTLTSTGTMSVYVHPSDALHGGLGVVAGDDVVIALSNSGETEELLALLPALKRRGSALIAIVGNMDSTLARSAGVVLDAAVSEEACPLNLAPTASTTVALAIGDALAMTLMKARGLTPEDFAANHPAGRLGKRLTLRVADLMHESPNVGADMSWLEVVRAISDHALGAVNVVDEDGRLVGIVTDGDLRRAIERSGDNGLGELKAEDMMTASPTTARPDMLAFDALKLMEDRPSQISVLPAVDDEGICVGLIRLHDIVKAGL
jgi:arabinose-5-phosphate isomerase